MQVPRDVNSGPDGKLRRPFRAGESALGIGAGDSMLESDRVGSTELLAGKKANTQI
jgi:hypothetical protein